MGNIVHSSKIDKRKWNQLVDDTENATIFSKSFYWESTADDWYAYLDPNYTYAIAFGVTQKLGIKSIYPPFYHRYTEILGEKNEVDLNHFEEAIKKHFSYGTLQTREDFLKSTTKEEYIFQVIPSGNKILKTQAKRMLKKASNYKLSENVAQKELSTLILSVMKEKLDFYNTRTAQRLSQLVERVEKEGDLISLGLYEKEKLVGGLFGLSYKNRLIYLKGACLSEVTKNGGMYLLMNELIEIASKNNQLFDFGGSRVEGVRYFNTRFNSEDKKYFSYTWNRAPYWFKIIQRIRKWVKK